MKTKGQPETGLCFTAREPVRMLAGAQATGAVPKVWGSLNYFKFTSEFKSAKI